jgi:hypothetical protein
VWEGWIKGGLSDLTRVGFTFVVGKRGRLGSRNHKVGQPPSARWMDFFFFFFLIFQFSIFVSHKGGSLANGISYGWGPLAWVNHGR